MKRVLSYSVSFVALLLSTASVWASTSFSMLYAFGDSLSDAGNNPAAALSISKLLGGFCEPSHPCPPYFDGRFSNGPVAVEHLANAILPGGGSPANFADFAIAGSTTGIGNYGDGGRAGSPGAFGLPGMAQQLGLFLKAASGAADPNALYFLWGGANDFLTVDSPIAAAQQMAGYVGVLASVGAEHFLVPNLPDLSLTPYVRTLGPAGIAAAHSFSVDFNNELALQLSVLRPLLPGAEILQFDTFAFFNNVMANPAAFGFTNVLDACLASPADTPCATPDSYLFWDDFHPSARGHALTAAAFAMAVPEPATVALLPVGLLALLALGRRSAAHARGMRPLVA